MAAGRRVITVLAASALALAGCSSASPPSADEPDTGVVGCSGSSMAETYRAGMSHRGLAGKYTFTLASATPAPPSLLANVWTVRIVDGKGASPAPQDVTANPFMPLMNHGSDQTPQVKSAADGTMTVSDVYLFMPGLWAVTFDVMSGTTAVDSAVFTFCIE